MAWYSPWGGKELHVTERLTLYFQEQILTILITRKKKFFSVSLILHL